MNAKLMAVLVMATVVAVTAVVLTSGDEPQGQVITQQPLVPGLADQLNEVQGLRLLGAGEALIAELQRGEEGWQVTNRDNYPADLGTVREALLGLAQSRLIEEKTSNPEFYPRLGVEDIDATDATGLRLEIDGLDQPLALIIGNPATGGVYARHADQARSWLSSGNPALPREIQQWLVTELLDIPGSEVQSMQIQHPDGEMLQLEKAQREQTDFSLANLPEGRELSSPGSANTPGNALAMLTLEDVGRAIPPEEAVNVTFRSFDGLVLSVQVFQQDEQPWLTFSEVVYDQALAQRFALPPTADGDEASEDVANSDATEHVLTPEAITAGQERATELLARVEGWMYQIPSFKYDNMTRRMADILVPEETPEASDDVSSADDTDDDELIPLLPGN